MTKPELGTKRLCSNCGAKYYDLNKDPILCPKCGTQFEGPVQPVAKARPQARPAEPAEEKAETETEAPDAEFVSLEQADEEAGDSGAVKVDVEDEAEIETDDDEDNDDTFLADDEDDEDEDVSDIIGDVEEDET